MRLILFYCLTIFLFACSSYNNITGAPKSKRSIATEDTETTSENLSEGSQLPSLNLKKLIGIWKGLSFKCESGIPIKQTDKTQFDRFAFDVNLQITDKFISKRIKMNIKAKKEIVKKAKAQILESINYLKKEPHNSENEKKMNDLVANKNQLEAFVKGLICTSEESFKYTVNKNTIKSTYAGQTQNSCPSGDVLETGNNAVMEASFDGDNLVLSEKVELTDGACPQGDRLISTYSH